MQQKFKIGDKVKVLTNVYPVAYGTEGVVKQVDTKSSHVYVVEHGICDGQMDCMYGHFDHDSWRYCFYERELELVEDKPKTKFKVGDKVRCIDNTAISGNRGSLDMGAIYTVGDSKPVFVYLNNAWYSDTRFELVTDQEVCNTEPDYVIGQEVYVSNDFNRYLRKGVLLDAIPRNGLMYVNIGGFDCYVEEERVYTKEMKGD